MRAGARSALARKQNHANFYSGTEAPSARYAEDGATPAAESRYQEALPTNGFYKNMRTSDYSAAGDDAAGDEHVAPTDDYQREYKGPSAASPPTWNPPTHPPKPPEPPFSCVAWLFPWAGDAPMEHTPADEEPPPAPEGATATGGEGAGGGGGGEGGGAGGGAGGGEGGGEGGWPALTGDDEAAGAAPTGAGTTAAERGRLVLGNSIMWELEL